jgi:hypothetical protein
MILAIGTWFAKSALGMSPVGMFLKRIPAWLWYVIIAGLVVLGTMWWHSGKVEAYGKAERQAGRDEIAGELNAKAQKLLAAALKLNSDTQKLRDAINAKHGKVFAADLADLDGRARSLLMRGPRATQCLDDASGRGLSGVPGGADRQGGAARGNARVAGPGVWASWFELVERGKLCDIDQRALRRWEGWHDDMDASDKEWREKASKPLQE